MKGTSIPTLPAISTGWKNRPTRLGLTTLRAELEKVNQDRAAELGRIDSLQKSLQSQDFSTLVTQLGSDALNELQKQRENLATRIASTGDNSAEAISLRAELAKVDKSLASAASQEVNNLQQTVNDYQQQANEVRQKIRSTVLQSDLPPEVLTEIYSLPAIVRDRPQSVSDPLVAAPGA